ncbi:MAG TPA: group III truncated hemoglobin [Chitinophagaceae bacterium]|jgi:hemoglobin
MTNHISPQPKTDILTEEDIKTLVHRFYAKVRKDELLAPVFKAVIKDNWDEHLARMCDFWGTLLLYTRKYLSDPMVKHMPLPIEPEHFERWLLLFGQTVDELFAGDLATDAKRRAGNIARLMNSMKTRT